MSSRLDQIVKGAAPPVSSRAPTPDPSANASHLIPGSDPLTNIPSSPPQIYLNLLILEASLRSQYLTLRDRRRQNTFFLLLLAIWNTYFFYALFLQPREDGSGIGGSVYWVIEMTEKVALMGGVVTGILIWGTGQWERGVRWPRRFIGAANRGLRTVNCKMVIIRGSWWRELIDQLGFLFPYSSLFPLRGNSFHYIDGPQKKGSHHQSKAGHEDEIDLLCEEDLAPGGDHIKLLLLPKPFSPDFRENWELYRTEYWEKENERRSLLFQRLRRQERQHAKERGGWLWWTGWRGWNRVKVPEAKEDDVGKIHTHRRHQSERDTAQKKAPRKSGSHSRNSSRSSVLSSFDTDERPNPNASRRGSSSGNAVEGRRRSKVGSTLGGPQVGKLTSLNRMSSISRDQAQSKAATRSSRSSERADGLTAGKAAEGA